MTSPATRSTVAALAVAVSVADQITKGLVARSLELYESRSVVDGFVALTYVHNRGGAFSVLADANLPYQSLLFALLSLFALCAIVAYAWKLPGESRLPQAALGLIAGGAVGNLFDRARFGYVRDFLDVSWGRWHWPAFNLADSCITIGVVLLLLDMLLNPEPGEERAGATPSAAGRTE